MNIVTYKIDITEIVPIFTDFLVNHLIDKRVRNYKENKGNVCYSNYYWNKCNVMNTIAEQIEDILKEYNFLNLIKYFSQDSLWTFTYIAEIIDLAYLDDYQQFRDRLEYFQFPEEDIAKELFKKLDEFFEKYKKIFDCYERITEANAKAVLTKAIYNPRTPIGKIHIDHLYNENF
jgi:hypothetical protein